MICCLDVDYQPTLVTTACAGFDTWPDEVARIEVVIRHAGSAEPYHPGAFYQRELPHVLRALERMPAVDTIIVDAYVWLGVGQPGLGKHLHDATGVAVIGVAKTRFSGADAIEVERGTGSRPLYVTTVGMDEQIAAAHIRSMHGAHRIPTLIKRVDTLARARAT